MVVATFTGCTDQMEMRRKRFRKFKRPTELSIRSASLKLASVKTLLKKTNDLNFAFNSSKLVTEPLIFQGGYLHEISPGKNFW